MKHIILITALGIFYNSTIFGQAERADKRELPSDLLIKLSSNSRNSLPGPIYEITLEHDGKWSYEGFRGVHVGRFTASELRKAIDDLHKKTERYGYDIPFDRLSKADLVELLAEFKAVDFFKLGDKYTYGQVDPETGKPMPCVTHAREEMIYIRAGGREKYVQNYTGCFSDTSKKLTALGEEILLKLNLR